MLISEYDIVLLLRWTSKSSYKISIINGIMTLVPKPFEQPSYNFILYHLHIRKSVK